MTNKTLKQLFAELAESGRYANRRIAELAESGRYVDQKFAELAESSRYVDQKFAELAESGRYVDQKFAELAESSRYVDQKFAELAESSRYVDQKFAELAESSRHTEQKIADLATNGRLSDAKIAELAESRREVDALFKELSRQVGGLGNKFGSFTEGLALSSLRRILFERFRMECVARRPERRIKTEGRDFEVDMLGWTNGPGARVVIVEIKSHLTRRDLDQVEDQLRNIGDFLPEHRGKAVEGLVAAIDISDPLEAEVLRRGLHLAKASNEIFRLADPEGFKPRSFTA